MLSKYIKKRPELLKGKFEVSKIKTKIHNIKAIKDLIKKLIEKE